MSHPFTSRPTADEYPPYYQSYVSRAPKGDLLAHLEEQGQTLARAWGDLPEAAKGFRYGPNKWSVEEVIGHVVDIERAFSYRAMCFLRGLPEEQPGVDQDIMVPNSSANARGFASLSSEFLHLRKSNVELFRHLTDAQCRTLGRASGGEFSVLTLACILHGHAAHHADVIEERYAGAWGTRP